MSARLARTPRIWRIEPEAGRPDGLLYGYTVSTNAGHVAIGSDAREQPIVLTRKSGARWLRMVRHGGRVTRLEPVRDVPTCDTLGHDWFGGIASQWCLREGCNATSATPRFIAKTSRR